MKTPFLILFLCYFVSHLSGQQFRYTNTVFPAASVVTTDIVYGQAPFLNALYTNESNTTVQDLVMDIYAPSGDANTNRPAIIFAHSGAFITGNRNHDDMIAACDSFSRRGYVTATIDYRQGFYPLSNAELHGIRAVYRGIQDGRAAVRYLRANAATYGIDPDRIYLAGSSAGSFISLHSLYLDDPAEKPDFAGPVTYFDIIPPFAFSGPDLGDIDEGDNLAFSGRPNGIIGWWGAVQDTDLITASDNEGVFLAHGEDDTTVPFNSGSPFNFPAFPSVDGSNPINARLDALGLTNKDTYFLPGGVHEFHGATNGEWNNGVGGNDFWDTLVQKTGLFLWQQHKPDADFSSALSNLTVDFTDLTTFNAPADSWLWDFGDGNTSTLQHPTHTYATAQPYTVRLYVENDNLSWDTISQLVDLSFVLPVVWSGPLRATESREGVVLDWAVSSQFNNDRFEVEHRTEREDFKVVRKVAGQMNSTTEQHYTAIHPDPSIGTNYYRIKQIDYDGAYTYGNTVALKYAGEKSGFTVYPNPNNGYFSIQFTETAPRQVLIYDSFGRLIQQRSTTAERLDLSLSAGLYTLSVDGELLRVLVR